MKNSKNLFYCLIIALSLASCSDDDEATPQVQELPEILVQTSVDVSIGSPVNVNIENGGGEYRVFSANPEIATVELKNHKLTINAISVGKTAVVVSDKNNHIKALGVAAYLYKKIVLKQEEKIIEEITINKRLGYSKESKIIISQGHGGYQVSSENEEVATVTVNDHELVVTGVSGGETTVKITDAYGLEAKLPVKIIDTTIAYTQEELAEIMANDEIRYFYNDKTYYINISDIFARFGITSKHTIEQGKNKYGYSHYSYQFLLIFPGNTSIGKKQESSIDFFLGGDFSGSEAIEFEIIKNDGTKIWAVYSFIEDDVLHYGYFCDNINP